jgi:hypothetical protein
MKIGTPMHEMDPKTKNLVKKLDLLQVQKTVKIPEN